MAYKGVLSLPDVHQCMNTQAEHVAIIFAPVMYSVLLSGKKIVNKQLKTLGLKSTYAIFQESLWFLTSKCSCLSEPDQKLDQYNCQNGEMIKVTISKKKSIFEFPAIFPCYRWTRYTITNSYWCHQCDNTNSGKFLCHLNFILYHFHGIFLRVGTTGYNFSKKVLV